MGAKSVHYITYITTHLAPGFQGYNYISDTVVIAKINELVQKAQFIDPDQQDKYFTLERSSYFNQVFLTPGDVVTSWVIDESSGTTDKVTVDALIDLVSDKIPPRKLIMDRKLIIPLAS